MPHHQEIIDFWFKEIKPSQWYKSSEEFDKLISDRFLNHHCAVVAGETEAWREVPLGRLAEIIILDQFSRNIFRGTSQAFSQDPMALCLTQESIRQKTDQYLQQNEKLFLYMPFMHSESLVIHEKAVQLFTELGLEMALEYEIKHKFIIERFGHYPHRNNILKRESTAEEILFLQEPNSSF